MGDHRKGWFAGYRMTSRYPGFKHISFNLRLGRAAYDDAESRAFIEAQQKALDEYKAANPEWQPDLPYDTGPLLLPQRLRTHRHLILSFHVRYGKQLFSLRPEIEWIRKRIQVLERKKND